MSITFTKDEAALILDLIEERLPEEYDRCRMRKLGDIARRIDSSFPAWEEDEDE